MPLSSKLYYYWDSCVFISYLNSHPDRIKPIEDVLDFARNHKDVEIVTSAMSIAEVVKSDEEKNTRVLNPDVETQIKKFWYSWGITIVEIMPTILHDTRTLMRKAATLNIGGLRSADAIHLSTALWVEKNLGIVKEIHTYETRWIDNFHQLVNGSKVCNPIKPPPIL